MKSIPTVQMFMTYVPKTIGFDQSLEQAMDYMRKLHVRHLPVLKGGKLIGIVSDRDVNMALMFKDVQAQNITVEGALTPNPYFTTPDAPLNEVAHRMCENKYGCALVMDNGKLVGIFTAVDGMRALSELLKTRLAG